MELNDVCLFVSTIYHSEYITVMHIKWCKLHFKYFGLWEIILSSKFTALEDFVGEIYELCDTVLNTIVEKPCCRETAIFYCLKYNNTHC